MLFDQDERAALSKYWFLNKARMCLVTDGLKLVVFAFGTPKVLVGGRWGEVELAFPVRVAIDEELNVREDGKSLGAVEADSLETVDTSEK